MDAQRPVVAVIGTMDTKGWEVGYLREQLESLGLKPLTLDVGFLNPPTLTPDIDRETIIRASGHDSSLLSSGKRDKIIEAMGTGAGRILSAMENLAGVIAIGGNQGTALAGIAMQHLPIGKPKIIVSTVASGNIRPYVRYKDIYMVFSVADVEFGPNPLLETVLRNAAAALAGMVMHGRQGIGEGGEVVGITSLGSTGRATVACVKLLRKHGYTPLVFHASGAGGSAMEELIESGFIKGVLDINLHEVVGEVFPDDIYTPMKPRLYAAAKRGAPLVAAPGSINYLVFGPLESIPQRFREGRKIHYHNPYNLNVRLTREELMQVCDTLAQKLNQFKRKIAFIIPARGWSVLDIEGGELYEPGSNELFVKRLKQQLGRNVAIEELDTDINDPKFAELAVKLYLELSS